MTGKAEGQSPRAHGSGEPREEPAPGRQLPGPHGVSTARPAPGSRAPSVEKQGATFTAGSILQASGRSLHEVGECLAQTGRYDDEARAWFERAVAERQGVTPYGRVDRASVTASEDGAPGHGRRKVAATSPWRSRLPCGSRSAPEAAGARRAPSTSAASLAQATCGRISFEPAKVAKPQSAPAITRSRPTTDAKRSIRWATRSGCSTSTVDWVITPGISTASSGSVTSRHTCHSCSWRGFAASTSTRPRSRAAARRRCRGAPCRGPAGPC